MKKLLALCSFGLVLGLAAIQFGGVQAKSNSMDDDTRMENVKKIMKTSKNKLGSGSMNKSGHRFGSGCTGLALSGDDCKLRSGAKMGSGKLHSGDMKHLTGKFEAPKKIRRNEFNDDLHKALKFLDLKLLSKTEKKGISETVSQTRKDLKSIYKQMKTEYLSGVTVDFTGYASQISNEFSGFAADLRGYVKTGNESKFEEYITKKLNAISKLFTRKTTKK